MKNELITLLKDAKETLEYITESEEWETLRKRSSANEVVEQIGSFLIKEGLAK